MPLKRPAAGGESCKAGFFVPLWEIAFCKVKCGNVTSGGQLIEIRKKRREEYEREAERHRRKRGGAD